MTEQRNRLRIARAEKRISQWALAAAAQTFVQSKRTRISQNKLSLIENGYVDPSPDERAAIAQALGLSESDIFPETVA